MRASRTPELSFGFLLMANCPTNRLTAELNWLHNWKEVKYWFYFGCKWSYSEPFVDFRWGPKFARHLKVFGWRCWSLATRRSGEWEHLDDSVLYLKESWTAASQSSMRWSHGGKRGSLYPSETFLVYSTVELHEKISLLSVLLLEKQLRLMLVYSSPFGWDYTIVFCSASCSF